MISISRRVWLLAAGVVAMPLAVVVVLNLVMATLPNYPHFPMYPSTRRWLVLAVTSGAVLAATAGIFGIWAYQVRGSRHRLVVVALLAAGVLVVMAWFIFGQTCLIPANCRIA